MNGASPKKIVSFAAFLAALLLLVLLASMSLIAVVGSYFTRRSVGELSDRIVGQTLGRIEGRINGLLDQAMNQNAQGKLLLEGRQLTMTNFHQLGGFFSHSLEVLHDLSDLGIGLESNGDYLFAERLLDGAVRIREYVVDDSGQRVIRDWRWHGAERELLKVAPWDGYDPRKRPFYQRAVVTGTNTWTETYLFWHGNERGAFPGVTYATPLRDGAGQLVGMLNSDFDLQALCHFLAQLRRDMTGYAFVAERRLDGSRRLIAHPDPTVLPQDGDAPENLRDQVAATFVKTVLADDALRLKVASGQSIIFKANGEKYFGSARELRGPGQPPWILVVIIPVQDVMGGVYENDRRAFWTGLSCLAVTGVLALRLARRMAEPLRQLTREAQAIGRLELEPGPPVSSRVAEVVRLATSMTEMKSSLRSFRKFVPADIVREIVTTAQEARLGGQNATLTLFFSDLADFTAVAESLTPAALVEQIGEYLGEMSETIHADGGTVDKFIGDGIMAFWGAPRLNAEHAHHACRAALNCQRALEQMRGRWRQAGKPEMRMRIGLHTGDVIVGNIGSENRLNYTAIGDSVNLTSRIEGLNKFYGTDVLISATCAQAAGDAIVARPVDNVAVKGRTEGIVVYELLAMAEAADDNCRQAARMTAEAFEAYRRGEFQAARELYQNLRIVRPNDTVAVVMEARCQEFGETPPVSWDTVFQMKDK